MSTIKSPLMSTGTALVPHTQKWVRAKDGMIGGVCEGLGRSFDINPWVLRAFWLAAVLLFGTGLLFYVILWVSLPVAGEDPYHKRLLGVCSRIARRTDLDVGLVRALTVLLSLASLGATVVGYVILYFVLEDQSQEQRGTMTVS